MLDKWKSNLPKKSKWGYCADQGLSYPHWCWGPHKIQIFSNLRSQRSLIFSNHGRGNHAIPSLSFFYAWVVKKKIWKRLFMFFPPMPKSRSSSFLPSALKASSVALILPFTVTTSGPTRVVGVSAATRSCAGAGGMGTSKSKAWGRDVGCLIQPEVFRGVKPTKNAGVMGTWWR